MWLQNWQMRLQVSSNKKLVKFWKSHPSLFYQRLLQVNIRVSPNSTMLNCSGMFLAGLFFGSVLA